MHTHTRTHTTHTHTHTHIHTHRLVHMPYSMTNLKNLSALWIAENQNRPIVEMQLEHGSAQQDCKWLTCVLFPQQGQEAPYGEQTSLGEYWLSSQELPLLMLRCFLFAVMYGTGCGVRCDHHHHPGHVTSCCVVIILVM